MLRQAMKALSLKDLKNKIPHVESGLDYSEFNSYEKEICMNFLVVVSADMIQNCPDTVG